jgi:hypothetical protein
MKTSELTQDIVRHAILPATAMKDQEATMKWLALPVELRGRSRAAERIATLLNGTNMPRRAEPLPVPPASEPAPAPEPAAVEEAPASSPTVASVDIKADGSVTVRPSTFPPAPVAEERSERKSNPPPPPAPAAVEAPKSAPPAAADLTADDALKMIRATFLAWKGGQHVCGNAFKRMHEVESIIKRAGF